MESTELEALKELFDQLCVTLVSNLGYFVVAELREELAEAVLARRLKEERFQNPEL